MHMKMCVLIIYKHMHILYDVAEEDYAFSTMNLADAVLDKINIFQRKHNNFFQANQCIFKIYFSFI